MTVTVERFPREVREIETLWIPLASGIKLAARMWIPRDAEQHPVPAILEYVPYRRRDVTALRDSHMHPYIAGHGYACVRVDMRGSGDSDGVLTDEYLPTELQDGAEVIGWLAKQTWCTGTVGMIGNSWGGFNALQIAALNPPTLRAIITSCSTDDRYADDVHYMGGCLLSNNLRWASTMFAYNARPPDPAVVGDRWREMWRQRLEGSGLWVENWLRHQRRDAFWKHGSVCEDFGAIKCAVYAVGGWADGYTNAIPRLMAGLKAPKKALIGQWAHRFPHMALPGPAIGFLQDSLRWWDKWLKGVETGVTAEPAMRVWMQDSVPPQTAYATLPGRWVAEPAWPPPSVSMRKLVLNPGRLDPEARGETPLPILSPESVGQAAGNWCPHGLFPDMPDDQRIDDGGSLVFDTDPLPEALEILGAPVVELELASDKPQALVAVRLSDVFPSGAATRVSYGLLNLSHRESHEFPSPLQPGRRYRVTVQLNDLGQVVPKGHRLRLAVSTAYWPIAWPSPEPATLTVFAGRSHLSLPLRKASAEDAKLPPLPRHELPALLKTTTRRPGQVTQTVSRDRETGTQHFRAEIDHGATHFDGIGLDIWSRTTEDYSIGPNDPLSARAEVDWVTGYAREGWRVESKTRTVLTSTREAFHLEATIDAYENGTRAFARSWNVAIPRDHV
jgi:putative CocE/NonD family hydrolase